MEFSKEIIAERIKTIRIERGLNAVDVANAIGISQSAVSKIENGVNAPDIVTLFNLSQLLKVSTDYLLGISDATQQWTCDVCRRIIENPRKGYVVWKYGDNYEEEGYFKYKILHPSGLKDEYGEAYGCDYDRTYVYSSSLVDFVGDRGLVKLLGMIDVGPLHRSEYKEQIENIRDFLELFRRVQLPYYEEARFYWKDAYDDGYFDGANEIVPYFPSTLKDIIEKYKN